MQSATVHTNDAPSSNRFSQAFPPLGAIGKASVFWGLACALTCAFMLIYFRGWELGAQTYKVIGFYGVGAALAVYPSAYMARLMMARRSIGRLVFLIVVLALGTLAITASIFAFEYRLYFTQWHGDAFSRLWFWQQFFTAGGAVYTYLVLGLRLYVPIGIIALFATSWWVNRLAD